MNKAAYLWLRPSWVKAFKTPSNVMPTVAFDFINNKYYDGVNDNAALASLLNNAAGKVGANGLDVAGATNVTSNGAFTTAMQQAAGTVLVETNASDGATAGVIGLTTGAPDAFLIVDDGSQNKPFTWNGSSLYATNPITGIGTQWSRINRMASGWDGSGRKISFNDGFVGGNPPASNSGVYSARGQAVVGAWNNGFPFNGKIRRIVVWPSKLPDDDMRAITWPSRYLLPLRRYHMLKNGNSTWITLASGNLQFERTQPWTCNCEFILSGNNGEVIFTNVITGPPWYGYEVWITDTGQERGGLEIRVHIMSGWSGTGSTAHSLQVNSTTKIVVGDFYRLQVSYDGSGLASGVKIYLNGILETNIVDHNSLDASIINVPAQMYIMAQFAGNLFNLGWLGAFQMSNIVRNAAYAAAANASDRMPAVDSNHVLSFDMSEGSGLTLNDRSASGFNGTLSSASGWNVW